MLPLVSTTKSIKESFISQTDGFSVIAPLKERFPVEDTLIHSARTYYLLLPRKGLDSENWQEVNKKKRRKIIKGHLSNVCTAHSSGHIETIDSWLSNRLTQRELLSFYGKKLEELYGKLCFVCGKNIDGHVTVDHIFPHSKGGETTLDNLMLAHASCNSSKNARIPGEFLRWSDSSFVDEAKDIDTQLKFMIYLRDDFRCQRMGCKNSLYTGIEIDVESIHSTGLLCYDNLRTACVNCLKQS